MKFSTTWLVMALTCALFVVFNSTENAPQPIDKTLANQHCEENIPETSPSATPDTKKTTSVRPKLVVPQSLKGHDRARFVENLPFFNPVITATKADAIFTDNGAPGATPGDVIEYTVVISNTAGAGMDATGVTFTDQIDANTTLVPGSVNASPIGVNDSYTCIGNVGITVLVGSGVLLNDVEPDGTGGLTVSAFDAASTNGGTVSMNANGSFTYLPAPGFEGSDNFNYTVTDGEGATDVGTVTITVSEVIWFVDNNAGVNGDGRLGTPFNSLANFNSGAADEVDDIIFLYRNTATNYTGPLTLLNGQDLIGAGATSSIATISGINLANFPHTNALPPTGGANNPVIAHNATNLTLAQNNKLHGFNINNTGGTALTGNGFAAVEMRDMSLSNTNGTTLDLNNGTVNAILKSVSSSNATIGIDLTNITGTGTFQITGTGTTDGSGGTISDISQRGVNFSTISNTTNISLKNMTFTNASTGDSGGAGICDNNTNVACYGAVYLNGVTGVTLDNIDISNSNEQGIVGNNVTNLTITGSTVNQIGAGIDGGDPGETALYLRDLAGTCSITNSNFTNADERLFFLVNNSKTLTLTIDNCDFTDIKTAGFGEDAVQMELLNNSTTTLDIKNSEFRRYRTYGLQIQTTGTGTTNAFITNNQVSKILNQPGQGIEVTGSGTSMIKYNIVNNTTDYDGGNGIGILTIAGATSEGRIQNNTINAPGANGSGIPIRVGAEDYSDGIVLVENNLINNLGANTGISIFAAEVVDVTPEDPTMNATLDKNEINTVAPLFGSPNAIEVRSGPTVTAAMPGPTVCANVKNNKVVVNGGFTAFRARTSSADAVLNLSDAGANVNIMDYWENKGNTPAGGPFSFSMPSGNIDFVAANTCSVPGNPTTPLLDETPVVQLTDEEDNEQETVVTNSQTEQTPPSTQNPDNKGNNSTQKSLLSGETVTVNGIGSGFNLPAGESTTIIFRVTINAAPLNNANCQISNQGMVSGSNFTTVMTDDPDTGTSGDATITPLVPPTADFNGTPLTGCIPLQVNFTDISTSNGNIIGWAWDIDNNNTTDYTTQNPMHTYTAPGIYTVKLTVTDDLGCTDTEIKTNYVNAEEPQVNIAVAPTSVLENSGTALVFTVTRTGNATCELTVPFTITGTATNGTDYPLVSTLMVTIPANMNTATLSITPTDDNTVEADETIFVTLTDGNNYSVGVNSATGTITNDDAAVISIAPTTQAAEDATDGLFTISSTKAFDAAVTINFNVTGTATSGTDYSSIGTSVVLPANQTSVTIPVEVIMDAVVENDETVIVTLTSVNNASGSIDMSNDEATVTITDNDAATISFTQVPSQDEGDMSMTGFQFEVTLSAVVDDDVTVTFATMEGTATIANSDYQTNTNTITFPADGVGQTQTITIQVNGDTDFEQDETFKVMLSNIVVGTGRDVSFAMDGDMGTGTILNDDTPPVIINEVDSDTPTDPTNDAAEFVELYDGGVGNTPLDGLVLVFFNGSNDQSYAAYDLDGFTTDANGYFLIGNTGVSGTQITFANNFLQNGADAVALYIGDATDFSNGTAVTTNNLIDAIVYDTDDADDAGLLVLLNAGQPQVNENSNSNSACHSLQRIPNGSGGLRNTSSYVAVPPTPGAANFVPEVTVSVAPTPVDEDGATNLVFTFTRTGDNSCSALTVPFTVGGLATFNTDYTQTGAASFTTSAGTITIPQGQASATITVDPTADDIVEMNETVIITLTDASATNAYNLGTPSAATGTINNDDVTSVVSIARADANPTNAVSVNWTVIFSSDVTGLSQSNFTLVPGGGVAGAMITNVMGSGTTWTVTASTGTGSGTLGLDMTNSTGATDIAGNGVVNLTFTGEVYDIDKTPPTVTINQAAGQSDPTNMSPIVFDVVFSESVTGFDEADIDLSASTTPGTLVAMVMGSGTTYTVSVSGMTGNGNVSASILANAATDAVGNTSEASTSTDNTVTYDIVKPTVTINQAAGQSDPTNMSPIVFDVVFSESVTGFDGADVDLSASTAPGALVATVMGSGTTYTVSVSGMTGNGIVIASIPANAATDAAGNTSEASTSTDNAVTYDIVKPTVTINQAAGQSDPTNMSPIVFDVVFSESVTGFDGVDVNLSASTTPGALVATVMGSGTTYTVSVNGMTGNGIVIASIPANAATDAAGNTSEASTSTDNTVTYDIVKPTVTINQAAGQEDPTSITPVVFDVIFSESVTGFTSADVDLSATTAPGTLMAVVMGSGTTYTVSVSGMTDDGLIIVTIPADIVTDAAGNANFASTSTDNTVTYIFCAADGGEIVNSLSSESLEICQGTDPGFTFDATGEAADATYLYTFLLVNDADGTIVETATGDFNLAALTVGNYTVYGLSYANFNTPDNIAAYLAGKTISDVQNDDAGNDFCLDLTDTAANGNTNKIKVNPNPTAVISPDPAQVCEDDDLILDGNPNGGTPPYTHAWTGAGASLLSAVNVQSPTFNSPNPGMFELTYTVTDDNGCTGTDNITIQVDPQVVINPLSPQEICSTKKLPLADLYEGISYAGEASELIYTWSIKETEGENGTLSETSSTDPNAGFYTPGKDAVKRGYVTLILTVDNPNDTCEPVSASVRVKILKVDCGNFPWSGQ